MDAFKTNKRTGTVLRNSRIKHASVELVETRVVWFRDARSSTTSLLLVEEARQRRLETSIAWSFGTARQGGKIFEPSFDQGFALAPIPPLDLFLEVEGISHARKFTAPHQGQRATTTCVCSTQTGLALPDSLVEVDGAADVAAPVCTLKNVGSCHCATLSTRSAPIISY